LEWEAPNSSRQACIAHANVASVLKQELNDINGSLKYFQRAILVQSKEHQSYLHSHICLFVSRPKDRLAGDSLADATSYDNIGSIFQDREESGAFEQYTRALGVRQRLLVDNSLAVAISWNNLASLIEKKGDFLKTAPSTLPVEIRFDHATLK
jgi:hypothetical protein